MKAAQYKCAQRHCTVYLREVKMVKFMLYTFYHNLKKKEQSKGQA